MPLQSAEGTRTHYELALRQLDDLIYQCRRRGVRVILPLANFWPWQGGIVQYLRSSTDTDIPSDWSTLEDNKKKEHLVQFYNDGTANQLYKKHIKTILERTNTITNTKYRNEEAILMWELMNEPRPPASSHSDVDNSDFIKWIKESIKYIRRIDENHLVSTGMGGGALDDGSGPKKYIPEYYKRAHDISPGSSTGSDPSPRPDVWSLHLWVDQRNGHHIYDKDATVSERIDIGKDIIRQHAAEAKGLGRPMPFCLGEFGWYADRSARAKAFKRWGGTIERHADAALVWDLPGSYATPSNWDFGVFSSHTNTVSELTSMGKGMGVQTDVP